MIIYETKKVLAEKSILTILFSKLSCKVNNKTNRIDPVITNLAISETGKTSIYFLFRPFYRIDQL
jgi:hypothetical protein